MRFNRPCLQCNTLHQDKGDYCQSCRRKKEAERESDPERMARKRALYNYEYQKRRSAMVAEVIQRNLPCHICKRPFTHTRDITADHLIPGNPSSPLAPAHKSCNSRRGNTPLS